MKIALRIILFFAVMIAVLFGSAGRWDLPFFWAIIGIYVAYMVGVMLTIDPGLRRERFSPGPGGKDRIMRVIMLPLMMANWVLAGLDVGRSHWSDKVHVSLQVAALVTFAASFGFVFWAMRANPFFSPVVRIQAERGHRLITAGPYRYVRHPGYAGGLVASVCGTLALGSWWAMVTVPAYLAMFARRIVVEDRFLKENLDGYAHYAERVRYRLLPGVW